MYIGFISFGDGVGDSNHTGGDDEIVLDLDISVPVFFYQMKLTEIYVRLFFFCMHFAPISESIAGIHQWASIF